MLRTHYVNELAAIRQSLVQMGETTLELVAEALKVLSDSPRASSARASDLEKQTDDQYRTIRNQCLNLITLQAPVAGDARLLTGILDGIVELESIGDHAYEIASSIAQKPPSEVFGKIANVGRKILDLLSTAIDSWRTSDRAQAHSVRSSESSIHAECESLYEEILKQASAPGDCSTCVDLMLVCKHFERILRHVVYFADQAAEAAPLSQAG